MILAKTIKGYGMGEAAEGKNIAHQVKKMDLDSVRHLRDRFNLPVTDEQLENLPYLKIEEGTEEHKYLHARRASALKGYVPTRLPRDHQAGNPGAGCLRSAAG